MDKTDKTVGTTFNDYRWNKNGDGIIYFFTFFWVNFKYHENLDLLNVRVIFIILYVVKKVAIALL